MNNFKHEREWSDLTLATKDDPIASEALDRLAESFDRNGWRYKSTVRDVVEKARRSVRARV